MNHLNDNLARSGKHPIRLAFGDGSRLLVLPEHGRLIGLYPTEGSANFFWTNPALDAPVSSKAYFSRAGWPNPGGDRTWLAPEGELFIGDLARPAETYAVPAGIDPGCWRVEGGADGFRLRNESAVEFKRRGGRVQFTLTKEYRPAANPLRDRELPLSYAGYEQTTILDLEAERDGDGASVRLGLWSLLQLPKPGRMIVPTYRRAESRTVFGQVPPGDLTCGEHVFIWRMPDAGGNAKISVKAASLTGRAGYLHRTRGRTVEWSLVVRNFAVNPSGDYIDALWDDPADTGYAFQACAVNDGDERFNEMEYHAPAAGAAEGHRRSCDRSQLWAFRGGFEGIAEAMRALLGIDDISCSNAEGD